MSGAFEGIGRVTDASRQAVSEKGQANGYASLGPDGKVPASQVSVDLSNVLAAGADDGQELVVENGGVIFADRATIDPTRPPYNAVADAVQFTGSITSGQATLTGRTGVAADIGKTVIIPGAGAAGVPLQTTIASVPGGVITLAATASTTVSAATVTMGTDNTAAFTAAHATGRPVEPPAGDFLVLGSPGSLAAKLWGRGKGVTRIFHPSTAAAHMYRPTGTYATGVALTGNAAAAATALSFSTSGVAAGDYLRLRSEASWDATNAPGVKKGEIVRVDVVDSGSLATLSGSTVDSYATADSATVDKCNYLRGVDVRDITFINPTPDQGSSAFFVLTLCQDARFENVEFVNSMSASIVNFDCQGTRVIDCDFVDGGYASGNNFGYGFQACDSSVDCWVVDSRARRGHGGIFTNSTASGHYGVTRDSGARGCVASYFNSQPFHTHETGEFLRFENCQAFNGGRNTTFPRVFAIYAKRCTVIDPVVDNCYGAAIRLDEATTESVVKGGSIRNMRDATSGEAYGVLVRGSNCTVDGLLIDGVTDANAGSGQHDGSGIAIRSGTSATGTLVRNCTIKNTSGSAVRYGDTTLGSQVDNLLAVNSGRYDVEFDSGVDAKNVARAIRTRNSTLGTTNKVAGLYTERPQRPVSVVPGWGGDMPIGASTISISVGRLYTALYIPPRDQIIASIGFLLANAATGTDEVDVGIFNAPSANPITPLVTGAGAVTGMLTGSTSAMKVIPLTAPYMLRQGDKYRIGFSTSTGATGTPQARGVNLSAPQGANQGSTPNLADIMTLASVGSTIGVGTRSPVADSVCPFLFLIEA